MPTLYSSVRSPQCLEVSIVLGEKGVDFDRVEVDLRAKQQRSPAYLALSPLGHIPAYVDAHGTHIDSVPIVEHLDRAHPEPRLFPAETAAAADVRRWVVRAGGPMRDVSHRLYWQIVEPPAAGADARLVRDLTERGEAEVRDLERALERSETGWLVGAMSAADIAVFSWVVGYHRFGLAPRPDQYPRATEWLDRLRSRPSYAASAGVAGRPFVE